jgi:hypothetical protein
MSNNIIPNEFIGKEVRGYIINKPIGSGKFSVVFRAER